MYVTVVNPGFEYMIDGILQFQTEETTEFWSEPLYHFYPQLDKTYAAALPFDQKKQYFFDTLQKIYHQEEKTINKKVNLYQSYWQECEPQITAALSEAFSVDCSKLFDEMRCNVSLNPIEPRYLDTNSFDIFYLNSEKGFVGSAIHEIIHFVWFYVWHREFGDAYKEYESPTLKWILSEMVVESVMKDPRLSKINPYFRREQGGCIYPYFFDMKTKGEYTLDVLDKMYRSQPIVEFMKNSYAYCQKNEEEIREHIQKAEQNW